jgi:hypothetical protein
MNIPFIILAALAGIVILLLVAASFMKKDYLIERNIVINAPTEAVFDYAKHLKNQDYYNKWVMTDPEMKKHFTGIDGNVGFIYKWNGNKKAGEGEQEIIQLDEGKRVVSEVRFVRPFVTKSLLDMRTDSQSVNQTKVRWSTSSRMKYPMNIMLPMISNMLAKDMDISLMNLKRILEGRM